MQSNSKKNKNIYLLITLIIIGVICFLLVLFLDKENSDNGKTYENYDTITINGKEYRENLDKEVLLLVGLDSYDNEVVKGGYTNYSLADFIVVLVLDGESKTVTPIQINRDAMVNYPMLGVLGDYIGDAYGQIALSHTYGDGDLGSLYNVKETVSNLFNGIHIDYCLSITMDAIKIVNDDLGGIEVYVEDNFENVDSSIAQGQNVLLTGDQAMSFVRSRMGMDEPTNIARMKRQRQYLEKLFKCFVEKSKDEALIYKVINDVSDYLVSSANTSDMKSIIDRAASYQLADTIVLDGESVKGEKYMEFYLDLAKVDEMVIEQFTLKEN